MDHLFITLEMCMQVVMCICCWTKCINELMILNFRCYFSHWSNDKMLHIVICICNVISNWLEMQWCKCIVSAKPQTLSCIELHINSHFKFLRGAVQWYKCLRIGNIKRYDAVICVSINWYFKLLSDAMIQFHTNAFAFVRKNQYKHRIIGHAKHTYPQIWT